MANPTQEPEVRQALSEMQRYLSDGLAPLMVADSIELLMSQPPGLTAAAIQAWVSSQYRGAGSQASVADYLFHAMSKIHLMSDLKLIEREALESYLGQLGPVVVELCPPAEQELLRTNLSHLGEVESEVAASVEVARLGGAPGGPGGAAATAGSAGQAAQVSDEVARGLRRFTLMLERLNRGAVAAGERGDLLNQILATAAVNSRTGSDLDQYVQKLGELGIEARTGEIFKALGRGLPGWIAGAAADGSAAAESVRGKLDALHRMISMAPDPSEGARRFNEMVRAAVDQFNEGSLAQAAAMFDVAERIVAEKRIHPDTVRSIRDRSHEALSTEQLRKVAEKPERHTLLRRILGFFPALTPHGLLASLNGEPRREQRKIQLALLLAHGAPARAGALDRLESVISGDIADPEGYFTRNLIYLLRRIPRPADVLPDREVGLLAHLTRPRTSAVVYKEALAALAQVGQAEAEQILVTRLGELEQMAMSPSSSPYLPDEVGLLLDRAAASLARAGTPNAWRTLVNHAFKRDEALGDTTARLTELSSQDLSRDHELVTHLVETLRSELPRKVLGFVVQKRKLEMVQCLVVALSSTPAPAVRKVLEEVAARFPDQALAASASKALAGFAPAAAVARPAETPASSLTGDLELFGLPNLLQNLGESQVTGTLSLLGVDERPIATLAFEGGRIASCEAGHLSGESAIYQIFIRSSPGTFAFRKAREAAPREAGQAGGQPADAKRLMEVVPTILEAMRRHDEFQQARAIVPDGLSLKHSGTKPTRPPDEADQEMLQRLWKKLAAGATAMMCEEAVAVDSFRIRRCLAHWLEEGALAPAA